MSYIDIDRKRTRTAWQRERRDVWARPSFLQRILGMSEGTALILCIIIAVVGAIAIGRL